MSTAVVFWRATACAFATLDGSSARGSAGGGHCTSLCSGRRSRTQRASSPRASCASPPPPPTASARCASVSAPTTRRGWREAPPPPSRAHQFVPRPREAPSTRRAGGNRAAAPIPSGAPRRTRVSGRRGRGRRGLVRSRRTVTPTAIGGCGRPAVSRAANQGRVTGRSPAIARDASRLRRGWTPGAGPAARHLAGDPECGRQSQPRRVHE